MWAEALQGRGRTYLTSEAVSLHACALHMSQLADVHRNLRIGVCHLASLLGCTELTIIRPCCSYCDFGIATCIQACFKDPHFRAAHGRGRQYTDPSNFFASKAFKELDGLCNNLIGSQRPADISPTSVWQIGADGVRLITFGQRSAMVFAVRCEELPADMAYTSNAWQPFLIIEGPKEPTNLSHVLRNTVKTLCKHAPIPSPGVLF